MENFLETFGLSSLIHEKTCYKSLINPSCLDLFLINSRNVISAGLSDFHEILAVLKTTIVKVSLSKLFIGITIILITKYLRMTQQVI